MSDVSGGCCRRTSGIRRDAGFGSVDGATADDGRMRRLALCRASDGSDTRPAQPAWRSLGKHENVAYVRSPRRRASCSC
jgi:hypothetical protein